MARPECPPVILASGFADVAQKVPMREDSLFDIRSITKPVTALAALVLVDRQRLDLDASITEVLGEAGARSWADQVTLRHLLSHTSGLDHRRPKQFEDLTESRDVPLQHVAEAILRMPLAGKTGDWQYSSAGYSLAGRMVEVAAGKRFARFVTDAVLAPLGMRDTSFLPMGKARDRLASLYQWKDGKLFPWPRKLPDKRWIYESPDFGLYSTARDLSRLLLAVASEDFPLFSQRLRDEMLKPVAETDVKGLGQGLGWMVAQTDQPRGPMGIQAGCFGHNGAGGSMAWMSPGSQTAAVFLTQCFFTQSTVGLQSIRLILET